VPTNREHLAGRQKAVGVSYARSADKARVLRLRLLNCLVRASKKLFEFGLAVKGNPLPDNTFVIDR